jgi:hypothetical protein
MLISRLIQYAKPKGDKAQGSSPPSDKPNNPAEAEPQNPTEPTEESVEAEKRASRDMMIWRLKLSAALLFPIILETLDYTGAR